MSGFVRSPSPTSSFHPDDRTGLDVPGGDATEAPPTHTGKSTKEPATLWSFYNERGQHYDKDLVDDANNTVDVLLIFAGLFSAVVTAFISQTYPMLKQDPNDIMTSIYKELRNPGSNATLDEPFVVPPYALRVNCCLFAGLFTSMLVASLGILVRQWTRSYQRQLNGVSSAHLRARMRHFRYHGAKRCHFSGIVGLLSIFMHLALFISALGIIDLLLSTANVVGWVALSVFIFAASFFVVTTFIPLFLLDAPFRSPLSTLASLILFPLVKRIRHRLHHHSTRTRPLNVENGNLTPPPTPGDPFPPAPGNPPPPAPGTLPSPALANTGNTSGLDDDIGESEGKESDDKSIARVSIDLDLDIICHLLHTADKSTERWVLDACFQKLPELKLLEEQKPTCFQSRGIIIEVFSFLAEGCLMTTKGQQQLKSTRLPRAEILCEFLNWFLLLPRNPEETPEQKKRLQETLEKGGIGIAQLITKDIDNNRRLVIIAAITLHRFEHWKGATPLDDCDVCKGVSPSTWTDDQPPDEEKAHLMTLMLVQRTDCMSLWENNRAVPGATVQSQCAASLAAIRDAFDKYKASNKDKDKIARSFWSRFITDAEKEVSSVLKQEWFTPIRDILGPFNTQRSAFAATSSPPAGHGFTSLSPPFGSPLGTPLINIQPPPAPFGPPSALTPPAITPPASSTPPATAVP